MDIITGKQDMPHKGLYYGVEGVGKTTFASDAPNPVFIDLEGGTHLMNVARFQRPESFDDIKKIITRLATEKHEYKTLVIDTVDALEPMIWDAVIAPEQSWTSIESPGYGKGYVLAAGLWTELLAWLDRLQTKTGMGVILLGHATIERFANPLGEDFDRYALKMHKKASAKIREWADVVGFANYEIGARKEKSGKHKGFSTGYRLLHLQHSAAFEAKCRWQAPAEIPFAWSELIATQQGPGADALRQEITEAMSSLKNGQVKKIQDRMSKAGDDTVVLAKLLDWTQTQIAIQGAAQ